MPECEDEEIRFITHTLNYLAHACFFVNQPNLMIVAYVRGLSLSLKHGLNRYTSICLSMYACLLGSMGDFDAAYEAGNMAYKLTGRFDSIECKARTMAKLYCFTKHLKEPLHQLLDGFLKYYEEGMEGGDTEKAICNITGYTQVYLFLGLPLEPLLQDLERYMEQFEKFEKTSVSFVFNAFSQGIHCLCGKTSDPYVLSGDIIKETTFLQDVHDNAIARWAFHFMKLYVAYHLNQDIPELEHAAQAFWTQGVPLKGTPIFFLMNYAFLNGMAAMALEAKKRRKRKYRKIREQSIALIHTWEKKGVPWVSHMLLILRAERDRLNPKKGQREVKAAYDAAIRMASRTGYVNDCALANERCARYYFHEVGDDGWGLFYLKKAVKLYKEWGANAKLDQLAVEFPSVGQDPSSTDSIGKVSGTIRARERYKKTANDKHFAKICDLCSQEMRNSSSSVYGSSAFLQNSSEPVQSEGGSSSSLQCERSKLLVGSRVAAIL
eukprot:CAMPEP_0194066906 /NCGR_PEP_ID=MMETSP0009_2-20130614/86276_1 /TAXON_ID=210454 /ORGANISM="Grammatophora oceanica, Strain CCMP 410" /LENGTH=492 /DNA_ID=CAMNT_0038719899 /DNA_START=57 /DNA_END=1535 /DNA_ORIENTATION=-